MPTNIYREAVDIQDASNLGGLCRDFSRVVQAIQEEIRPDRATMQVKDHPVFILWLDKIMDMAGREDSLSRFSAAYDECVKKADAADLAAKEARGAHIAAVVQIGSRTLYRSRETGDLVEGFVAESAACPLSGKPAVRVVDFWRESADLDAGRWVECANLISYGTA